MPTATDDSNKMHDYLNDWLGILPEVGHSS
jgi:hypothetical protein